MKTISNLRPKPVTRFGETRASTYGLDCTFNADVERNQSIRIYGVYGNRDPRSFDRTFKLGDRVEYDSYNLIYTGPILSITDKSVTIDASGTGQTVKRLDLFWFVNKNWDYDAQRIADHNREERNYI